MSRAEARSDLHGKSTDGGSDKVMSGRDGPGSPHTRVTCHNSQMEQSCLEIPDLHGDQTSDAGPASAVSQPGSEPAPGCSIRGNQVPCGPQRVPGVTAPGSPPLLMHEGTTSPTGRRSVCRGCRAQQRPKTASQRTTSPGKQPCQQRRRHHPGDFIMQALPLLSSPDVKRRDPVSPRHVKKATPWCPRPALTRIPGPPRT